MTATIIRNATQAEKMKRRALAVGSFLVVMILVLGVALTTFLVVGNKSKDKETDVPVGNDPIVFAVPVGGQYSIMKEFSATELQYNVTLNRWEAHKATSLAAALGTPVLATYAGTVTSVSSNNSYGTVITIDHGDGLRTIYSGVDANVLVSSGDRIEKGQRIASVGRTAVIFEKDPPHVHIQVLRNGVKINPAQYIDFSNK